MHRLLTDCRAATAVEFALVTPVLLMFLLFQRQILKAVALSGIK